MAIIKRNNLLRYDPQSERKLITDYSSAINEIYTSKYPTVFISHSSRDKELVKKVVAILSDQGANCYVDEEDSEMPAEVSVETADRLRDKIGYSHKFVMVASRYALVSRWVPWELGVADEPDEVDRIAIFPVEEENEKWEGNDYVGLYDLIQEIPEGSNKWFVTMGLDTYAATPLAEWLAQWYEKNLKTVKSS
jgi:hypothetical protein